MAKRADELPEIETELDGFEVWDRTVRAPAGQAKKVAFVSLRVGGVIGANHALGEMLGWPAAVKVMFDPHRRRLGLVPSAPEDENSFETGWRRLLSGQFRNTLQDAVRLLRYRDIRESALPRPEGHRRRVGRGSLSGCQGAYRAGALSWAPAFASSWRGARRCVKMVGEPRRAFW